METAQTTINLARRLRPQQFSQIIGQEIPVRMLKNSLYLNKFFPVYLFAGQRGCGKTSTARVFAAAANCEALTTFQKNPTLSDIPCLICTSCLSMKSNAHPDFIEIDAASNTGVDNVRQLIETAAYVPLQGKKKIYLIDEAHMLSKAAFNALLKILEEPPVSVLFILATTELHKIPQTVLSRCFQLSFPALERQAFTAYLQDVCRKEAIDIDDTALALLIEETDGSARDALNLIEQVRFIESPITEISIRKLLGKLSTTVLLDLLEAVINNSPSGVLAILNNSQLQATNPQATWDLLVSAVKTLLWTKYASNSGIGEFIQYQSRLNELAAACSHNRLLAIMQLLWEQERIFLQTSKKLAFLEFLFLQLAEQDNIISIDDLLEGFSTDKRESMTVQREVQSPPQQQKKFTITPVEQPDTNHSHSMQNPATSLVVQTPTEPAKIIQVEQAVNPEWTTFLAKLRASSNDVVLQAILEQATYKITTTGELTLNLKQNSKFFTEKLEEVKPAWFPLLEKVFGPIKKILFDQLPPSEIPTKSHPAVTQSSSGLSQSPRPRPTQPVANPDTNAYKTFKPVTAPKITEREGEFITPTTALPFASLLVTHFPGRLKRLKNLI
jgi:DNA polymerase-3 subunit gamma/tau